MKAEKKTLDQQFSEKSGIDVSKNRFDDVLLDNKIGCKKTLFFKLFFAIFIKKIKLAFRDGSNE